MLTMHVAPSPSPSLTCRAALWPVIAVLLLAVGRIQGAEPVAQVVKAKVDLLAQIRVGRVEYHISQTADVKDDPAQVFTFVPGGDLRVSGRGYGGVTTTDAYKDYHLVIEFRWGQMTWGRRERATRDSGVLVHCFGPQGTMNDAWMASIEAQIIEGGVGDILVLSPKLKDGTVLQASIEAEVGRDRDQETVWTPGAPRQVMTTGRLNWQKRDVDWKDVIGFRGRDDVESPFGQWTRLEVIARGDTLEYRVNGVLVNRAFKVQPSQGRIQLQTEAAEMFVRRYELHPLDTFTEAWPPADEKTSRLTHPELPAYAARPAVMTLTAAEAISAAGAIPPFTLPAGFELIVAAGSPMIAHPTLGCVDERGRLFVGDSAGVNWNHKKFEEHRPNRVLMLEDRDGDGVFEHSTVFADGLTVPKGGCWAEGSLYVASPPGIWRFTDADDDGVAEQRELMVDGFAWTANGADVHGPWRHPDGRLYWTHGRKGHEVKQPVHKGLHSGVWSMKPDGSDIRVHALACADNPVALGITPTGELIGTVDLYFGSPRVDTIMHWQLGGLYERPDYLHLLAGLPRTHERMPILKDLGHVVPSGACFWTAANALVPKGQAWSADPTDLQYLVSFYNSRKITRFALKAEGSTWRADEHDFLTVERAGAHLSDVIEAPDGSLLVLDTGTWYSHCPSSLLDGGNVTGRVYRIRRTGDGTAQHVAVRSARKPFTPAPVVGDEDLLKQMQSANPAEVRRAIEALTFRGARSHALSHALLALLAKPADAVLEHTLLHAGITLGGYDAATLAAATTPLQQARLLRIVAQTRAKEVDHGDILRFALGHLDDTDATLAEQAYLAVVRASDGDRLLTPVLDGWLTDEGPSRERIAALERLARGLAGRPGMTATIARMLAHGSPLVRQAGLRAIAAQAGKVDAAPWQDALGTLLAQEPTPALLDAIARVKDARHDARLTALAGDNSQPPALRLKALLALSTSGATLSEPAFALLMELLGGTQPALRLDAASRLANAKLTQAQWDAYLAVLPNSGPLEQAELLIALALPQKYEAVDVEQAKRIAATFARSPMLGTFRPDLVRKAFGFTAREVYALVEPAFTAALAANEAKKVRMDALAVAASQRGNASTGRALYESGKGICIACHRIGSIGQEIGPNLSKIGGIRVERELIESILFPSNTIARDYDQHLVQLTDGGTAIGLITARSAAGITLTETSGHKRLIPHENIVSDTQLTTSLMPPGLDAMFSEQELLDLVAYLRSLK
jgi:putative heme-binding domain-containing protein